MDKFICFPQFKKINSGIFVFKGAGPETPTVGAEKKDSAKRLKELQDSIRESQNVLEVQLYELGKHDSNVKEPQGTVLIEGSVDATKFTKGLKELKWYQKNTSAAKTLLAVFDKDPRSFTSPTYNLLKSKEKLLRKLAGVSFSTPKEFRDNFEKGHSYSEIFGRKGIYNIVLAFQRVLDMARNNEDEFVAEHPAIAISIGSKVKNDKERFSKAYSENQIGKGDFINKLGGETETVPEKERAQQKKESPERERIQRQPPPSVIDQVQKPPPPLEQVKPQPKPEAPPKAKPEAAKSTEQEVKDTLNSFHQKYGIRVNWWSDVKYDWPEVKKCLPNLEQALRLIGRNILEKSPCPIKIGRHGWVNDNEGLTESAERKKFIEIDYDENVDDIKEQILKYLKELGVKTVTDAKLAEAKPETKENNLETAWNQMRERVLNQAKKTKIGPRKTEDIQTYLNQGKAAFNANPGKFDSELKTFAEKAIKKEREGMNPTVINWHEGADSVAGSDAKWQNIFRTAEKEVTEEEEPPALPVAPPTITPSLIEPPALPTAPEAIKGKKILPAGIPFLIPGQLPIDGVGRNQYPSIEEWYKLPDEDKYYPVMRVKPVGKIRITSGFMEPKKHGYKTHQYPAIFPDGKENLVGPGKFNIGIDYVVMNDKKNDKKDVQSWYGGEVVFAGVQKGDAKNYGRRLIVKTDIEFLYKGEKYRVYQAYGHLRNFAVQKGKRIEQGEKLGVIGGSGGHGYPLHVDLRTFILPNGATLDGDQFQWVEISPNYLEKYLAEKNKEVAEQNLPKEEKVNLPPDQKNRLEKKYKKEAVTYAVRIVENGIRMKNASKTQEQLARTEEKVKEKYKLNRVPRWFGYINDSREIEQIAAMHKARAEMLQRGASYKLELPMELIIGAMSNEGQILDVDIVGTEGTVSGIIHLGLDWFGKEFSNIVEAGLLPQEFEAEFTKIPTHNEAQKVISANFSSKEAGIRAFIATLAFRQKKLFDHFADFNLNLLNLKPEDRKDLVSFFTYIYFNAGYKRGRQLVANILEGKDELVKNHIKGNLPEQKLLSYYHYVRANIGKMEKRPASVNSCVVMAGAQWLVLTGAIDEHPEKKKYWWL